MKIFKQLNRILMSYKNKSKSHNKTTETYSPNYMYNLVRYIKKVYQDYYPTQYK